MSRIARAILIIPALSTGCTQFRAGGSHAESATSRLGRQVACFDLNVKGSQGLQFHREVWIEGKLVESEPSGQLTARADHERLLITWRGLPDLLAIRISLDDEDSVDIAIERLLNLRDMKAVAMVCAPELRLKLGQRAPVLGISFGRQLVTPVNLSDPAGSARRSDRAIVLYVEAMPEAMVTREAGSSRRMDCHHFVAHRGTNLSPVTHR